MCYSELTKDGGKLEQTTGKTNNIKSIIKAANVLNLLADAGEPMSLAQMASELNISKSTLHGIVATLVDVRFLAQDQSTGRYHLGTRLFQIGSRMSSMWNERKIAYSYIQQIAAEVGETVHMAVLDDYEVLYINKQESSSSIRIVTDIGAKLPAYCTGLGKALLSDMSKQEFQYMLRKIALKRYTDFTITDPDALWKELEMTYNRGYGEDDQEYIEGLRCVAAPILNHEGKIVAALSISGPVSRMQSDKLEQCKRSLLSTCDEISVKMGYEKGEYNIGSV